MKKLGILIFFLSLSFVNAQEKNLVYKEIGNWVQVTYYHANGVIKEIGFFNNKKLTGTWERFDTTGEKIAIAHYKNGKKIGKWFLWGEKSLKEINYNNNVIVSVQTWREDSKLAVN